MTNPLPILLLDLDDTLLSNHMETFIPAYLQALAGHMKDTVPPEAMLSTLLRATLQMQENQRPDRTLKETFDAAFYPALGVDEAALRPAIRRFYREVFPTLRSLTRPRPQAARLIEEARRRGHRMVVATNPLFPLTAQQQRVQWAGLRLEDFEFVTGYEDFHFAKPSPAYYAEILARLGWPQAPVVMLGNDEELDLVPARALGVHTFHVPKAEALAEFFHWLDAQDALEPPPPRTPPALTATLRATPAALRHITCDLPAERWRQRPRPEAWCLTEILCHLRDVEREVNLPRLQTVLRESNPFLAGQDTDPWAEERHYHRQDGAQALAEFLAARLETLALLDNLSAEDWQRPARHAIFGPTYLLELVDIIAAHDRLHIQQVHTCLFGAPPEA